MKEQSKLLSRRQILKIAGLAAGGTLLAACGAQTPAPAAPAPTEAPKTEPAAPAPTEAPKAAAPAGARKLPDDAAPIEQQVLVQPGDSGRTYLDLSYTVYNRHVNSDLYSMPPVRFNHDFELLPGSAKSWKVDDKGTTWTFTLRDDIKWSDGKNLNADDFVTTFQYYADPKVAHDFNWYFADTKVLNFGEATKGDKPITDVGVRKGANEFELVMETTGPVPYLPLMLTYSTPLHATVVKDGDGWNKAYNIDPAKAVSSGPYLLKEYSPERVVAEANPNYPEDLKPYIQKVIGVVLPPEQRFQAYQANQIDHMQLIQTADIQTVLGDAKLKSEVSPDVGDFRCDYMFFDVTKAPFDNKKFRQALSHLVNRDAIIENITTPLASRPAYSFLAPGFPGHNPELSSIQNFDPEKAKALYAESGVKVDKLLLEVRGNDGETRKTIGEFIGATVKENLGIDVEVAFVEQKIYMDKLNAKPTQIGWGMISYGMDYLDQSNMLSVFRTGGRHNWNNADYQKLLDEAGPLTDKAKRDDLYKQAEKLLVEDVPAVFIAFRTVPKLLKPYVKGQSLQPGKLNTVPGLSWPDYSVLANHVQEMYIGKNVSDFRKTPPA
jgi:peptide/nickel transport system substrate-binding protein/oligopeptide transport system substrate-binding protein